MSVYDDLFNLGAENAATRQVAGVLRMSPPTYQRFGRPVSIKTPQGNKIGTVRTGTAALGWRKA
jgi:hypothetical protein